MKKLLLIFLAALLCNSCSNDDYGSDAALPPATTTGAGTFACKVNGKSFIDPGSTFNCFYQYNNNYEGYFFGINGRDEDYEYTNLPWSISLVSTNVVFEEGETYQFFNRVEGNVTGYGSFVLPSGEYSAQETTPQFTGELTLTKFGTFDGVNIISGTFWFDVPHPVTGEAVHITDGRFDTKFSE